MAVIVLLQKSKLSKVDPVTPDDLSEIQEGFTTRRFGYSIQVLMHLSSLPTFQSPLCLTF